MPHKHDEHENYLTADTMPPKDDPVARKRALALPVSGHIDLSDIASAALEHADVIDQMFDDMLLPEAPATVITRPPKEEIIHLSEDDEDVILLDDDDIASDEEEILADEEEEAFYRQFMDHD